jgi:hypothetical protein
MSLPQNDAVAIDRSGELWRGENADDLAECIRHHRAGGYPVAVVVESTCRACGGGRFRVNLLEEDDATQRVCLGCGSAEFIGDSAEYWDNEEYGECQCPCGGEEFAVSVGFALFDDGDVRWMSVGLRCLADNAMGVYADTKIDYSPSRQLLEQA